VVNNSIVVHEFVGDGMWIPRFPQWSRKISLLSWDVMQSGRYLPVFLEMGYLHLQGRRVSQVSKGEGSKQTSWSHSASFPSPITLTLATLFYVGDGGSKFLWNIDNYQTTMCHIPEDIGLRNFLLF
jgi:hypothetical protein